jgi:hypothetical protein
MSSSLAGTPVTLFLKVAGNVPVDANYTVRATIEIKDSDGSYHEVGALTGQDPARVIDGPCTVRVSRLATTTVRLRHRARMKPKRGLIHSGRGLCCGR